jgi:long-subunit fatty acid transport protein
MSRAIFISAAAFVIIAAFATDASAAGPDLMGPGIRSRVLGAIADPADWTAVYWNPAGLIALENAWFGMDLAYLQSRRRASKSFSNMYAPDIRLGEFQNVYPVEPDEFLRNSIRESAVLPQFGFCYNAKYFAVGMLNMPAMSLGADFRDRIATSGGDVVYGEHRCNIYTSSLPIAAAVPLGSRLSLGVALHGRFGLRELYQAKSYAPVGASSPYAAYVTERSETAIGYRLSLDVAAYYRHSGGARFGIVVRTPYKFRFPGTAKNYSSITGVSEETDALTRMYCPLQLDAGAAFALSNDWTLHLSMRHTSWNTLRFTTNYRDNTGTFLDNRQDMKMRQTLEAGVGVSAELGRAAELFAGARYEPSPYGSDGALLITGNFPNAVALGAGVTFKLDSGDITLGAIERVFDRRYHAGDVFRQDAFEAGVTVSVRF